MTLPGPHEQLPEKVRRKPSIKLSSPWTSLLVMAAVFLLAFGVGTLLPRGRDRSSQIDVVQPPTLPARGENALANDHHPVGQPTTDTTRSAGNLYLGDLKLVSDTGKEIEVPVYDWNQQVAEELMYRSQPLSPDIVRQLKRHQVRSSRSYFPVRLQDGRQVVLPVQEVDITPVRGTAY